MTVKHLPEPFGPYTFRRATTADAPTLADLVDTAYQHYIARIGARPGPMTEDYAEVIRNQKVIVAEAAGAVVGLLVLDTTDEGFLIDNIAVHPAHRGAGLGRALLVFAEAEARRTGFDSIYLYTHEKMTENRELYSRLGYVEFDRRGEGAFARVFMRKRFP